MLKQIAGYSAYMFVTTSVIRLLTFGVGMLAAGVRSREDLGDFGTYVLIAAFMEGLSCSGVNATIQRFSAADEENRLRFAALAYRFFFAFILVAAAGTVGVGLAWNWTMALAVTVVPFSAFWYWARYLVRSRLDARWESKLVVIGSIINSSFQFAFLTLTSFSQAMIYGHVTSTILIALITAWILPGALGFERKAMFTLLFPRPLAKEAFNFLVPVWISGVLFTGSASASAAICRVAIGAAAIGVTTLAAQIWQFALTPIELINQAILPGIAAEKKERPALVRELSRMMLLSLPNIAIGVAVCAPILLRLLRLEAKWSEVPLFLLLLAFSVPFRVMQSILNNYCLAEGRSRLSLYGFVAQTTVSLLLAYPVMRTFGVYGVVAADCAGVFFNAVLMIYLLGKESAPVTRSILIWTTMSIASSGAALFFAYQYLDWQWSWAMAVPACLIYSGMMFVFRVVGVQDFVRIKNAVRERYAPAH